MRGHTGTGQEPCGSDVHTSTMRFVLHVALVHTLVHVRLINDTVIFECHSQKKEEDVGIRNTLPDFRSGSKGEIIRGTRGQPITIGSVFRFMLSCHSLFCHEWVHRLSHVRICCFDQSVCPFHPLSLCKSGSQHVQGPLMMCVLRRLKMTARKACHSTWISLSKMAAEQSLRMTFSGKEPEPSAWHYVPRSWIAMLTQRMHSETKEIACKSDPVFMKLTLDPLSSVCIMDLMLKR